MGKGSRAAHTLRGALQATGTVVGGPVSQLSKVSEAFGEALGKVPRGSSGNSPREGKDKVPLGVFGQRNVTQVPDSFGEALWKVPGVVFTNSPLKEEGKIPLKDFGECPR